MADFQVTDQITRQIQNVDGTALRLGRVGLLDVTKDNLSVIALTDNVDITTGPGNDAIMARGGFNFINPGDGNNVMTGGVGQNAYTFAIPTAGTSHDLITNFHVGDSLHIGGTLPSGFQIGFSDVTSSLGSAFEIAVEPIQTASQKLLVIDLPGFSSADFQDDPATTRLTFVGNTLSVIR